ncbi:MAG: VTT domain-containing protein [Gemmatimonadota bacterium]|nr:VTT domain-containing protein [Gemmatimonadota bacterium]
MEFVHELLETWGYGLLFAVGFAEFIGVPMLSSTVLVLAGAAVVTGGSLSLPLVIAAAAAGGFVADQFWFHMARWKGRSLIDLACGLSSNPNACGHAVVRKVEWIGPFYVLPSKFLPGTGNLIAISSGIARLGPWAFAAADAVALLAWAALYSTLGRLFADEVALAVDRVASVTGFAGIAALSLFVAAVAWRWARVRRQRRAAMADSSPPPGASGAHRAPDGDGPRVEVPGAVAGD